MVTSFLVQLLAHLCNPALWESHLFQCGSYLLRDFLLANVRLDAWTKLLGAAEVLVPLLNLHGDEPAALAATEQLAIDKGFDRAGVGLPAFLDDLLDLVKEVFADQWLVLALIELASIPDQAVVEGIAKQAVVLASRERLVLPRGHAKFIHGRREAIERAGASGIQLKGFADQWPSLRIRNDGLGDSVIEVANGCKLGPQATLDLALQATVDIVRELVHVILAHAEGKREHELALRRILKPVGGELDVLDDPDIQEVDDLTTINRVAGEAVGVPGEDANRFARGDAIKHLLEDRPARFLGRLALGELMDHLQVLLGRKLAKFRKLVGNAPDLPVGIFGGFAGVDEIFEFLFHGDVW